MKLTPVQNLMLLNLAVSNEAPKMGKFFTKKDRVPLEKEGLIHCEKVGPGKRVYLTDHGWDYLNRGEKMQFSSNKFTGPTLERFHQHVCESLARKDAAFAELFTARAESQAPKFVEPSRRSIAEDIKKAYLKLTQGRLEIDVRFKHLRQELGDIDRLTLDYCLMGMLMSGVAQARQIDDPLVIDLDDRSASLNTGGSDRHLFRMMS